MLTLDLPTDQITDNGDSFAAALEVAFAGFGDTPAPAPQPEAPAQPETPGEAPAEPQGEPQGETLPEPSRDPLDDLVLDEPTDLTPKAGHAWVQLKSELKQTKTELEQLRTELAQRDSRLQELQGELSPERVQELEQQLEQLRGRQLVQDLESTEVYREAVTIPLQGLLTQANELAERYGIDQDALMDAFALEDEVAQDEQLQELAAEANMSDRDRARLYRILEDMNPIFQRRDELSQNAEAALLEARQLEEQKQQIQAAERARERSHVAGLVVQRLQEKVPFLKSLDGVDLQALQKAAADRDPAALPPVDLAYREVAGGLFPALIRNYAALQQQFDAAMEKLASYQSAEPGAGAGGGISGPILEEEMTFEEAMRRRFGS